MSQQPPICILCRSPCAPDMNYCLPQCDGRRTGRCHFFCQRCWETTLSRMKCELAQCTGCHIGHPPFLISMTPVAATTQAEDDVMMSMC